MKRGSIIEIGGVKYGVLEVSQEGGVINVKLAAPIDEVKITFSVGTPPGDK